MSFSFIYTVNFEIEGDLKIRRPPKYRYIFMNLSHIEGMTTTFKIRNSRGICGIVAYVFG